jgi:hypothetical protein
LRIFIVAGGKLTAVISMLDLYKVQIVLKVADSCENIMKLIDGYTPKSAAGKPHADAKPDYTLLLNNLSRFALVTLLRKITPEIEKMSGAGSRLERKSADEGSKGEEGLTKLTGLKQALEGQLSVRDSVAASAGH